jgi:hypothetical protein
MFRDVTIHTEKQPAPILKAKLSVCVERSNNQGCKGAELRVSTDHARRVYFVRLEPGTSQSHPVPLSIKPNGSM